MTKIICVIGTDTEIGKTYTCCQLMEHQKSLNKFIITLKPIASGVINSEYGNINPDVFELTKVSNYPLATIQINPFLFQEPIAPHIAAKLSDTKLTVSDIADKIKTLIQSLPQLDTIFIEGVGGLMTPINDTETYQDLLVNLGYQIILVIGVKLGCLNHALLTVNCILKQELPLIGWIANKITPDMPYTQENIEYLTNTLPIPLIATIEYNKSLSLTADFPKELL